MSPSSACGLSVATSTYRGLVLSEGSADVYFMGSDFRSGGLLAEGGTFDGYTISYAYETSGVTLTGLVEFPELK